METYEKIINTLRSETLNDMERANWTWIRRFYDVPVENVEMVIEVAATEVDTVITINTLGGFGLYATTNPTQAARHMAEIVNALGGW